MKNKIREEVKEKLSRITTSDKDFADSLICEAIANLTEVKNADVIALYAAIENEVNLSRVTMEFIKLKKRLCFPRALNNRSDLPEYEMVEITDLSDLKIGRYGIPEPKLKCRIMEKSKIDLWLVPGVAFAPNGIRLGRGKGVYDRLLKDAVGKKIGILYQTQLQNSLPSEQHDIKMNMLITEKGVSVI